MTSYSSKQTGGEQMRKRSEDKECSSVCEDIGRQPNIQSRSPGPRMGRVGWGKGAGVGGEGVGGVQQCSQP